MIEDELPLKISFLKVDPHVEIKSHQKRLQNMQKELMQTFSQVGNLVQILSQLKVDPCGTQNQALKITRKTHANFLSSLITTCINCHHMTD